MTAEQRLPQLERLLEIGRALSSTAGLEEVLQAIIAAAAELTGCAAASILELEQERAQFCFLAVPASMREALQAIKVPVNESLAGWVVQNGRSRVVPDTSLEPRFFRGAYQASGFVIHSLMVVPILFRGVPIGVLAAINKPAGADYTGEDQTVLETLAAQAALAIQISRLLGRADQAPREMEELDRMKSDFIAIASHELRTPLGLILGHATFLREVIQAEQRPQLEIIVRNSLRLKEIIENIANMDNVQSGMASIRRQVISMNTIVEEVTASYLVEARQKEISLQGKGAAQDLLVDGDATKITLALGNLVKNAITFTDAGGHVTIIAEPIPGYARVLVVDDGIGIPEKDLPHIFERFYQVESHLTRKHAGMGLGLSVAKVMIELHGGRMWVESEEGKGSTFAFILPLAAGPARDSGGSRAG
jgi:signal transduction histidine kinase